SRFISKSLNPHETNGIVFLSRYDKLIKAPYVEDRYTNGFSDHNSVLSRPPPSPPPSSQRYDPPPQYREKTPRYYDYSQTVQSKPLIVTYPKSEIHLRPIRTQHHPQNDYWHYDFIPGIPGRPWKDYPLLINIPYTSFSCNFVKYPGYYADVETGCQVWHFCQLDGRHDKFLCPNGTIFNQETRVCDWWYNVHCPSSFYSYDINADLYGVRTDYATLEHVLKSTGVFESLGYTEIPAPPPAVPVPPAIEYALPPPPTHAADARFGGSSPEYEYLSDSSISGSGSNTYTPPLHYYDRRSDVSFLIVTSLIRQNVSVRFGESIAIDNSGEHLDNSLESEVRVLRRPVDPREPHGILLLTSYAQNNTRPAVDNRTKQKRLRLIARIPVKSKSKNFDQSEEENKIEYNNNNFLQDEENREFDFNGILGIPGIPGVDYPNLSDIPKTSFTCTIFPNPGYYADYETGCQVWHYCQADLRQDKFLCPNGTIFNQHTRICDWWFNVRCVNPSAFIANQIQNRIQFKNEKIFKRKNAKNFFNDVDDYEFSKHKLDSNKIDNNDRLTSDVSMINGDEFDERRVNTELKPKFDFRNFLLEVRKHKETQRNVRGKESSAFKIADLKPNIEYSNDNDNNRKDNYRNNDRLRSEKLSQRTYFDENFDSTREDKKTNDFNRIRLHSNDDSVKTIASVYDDEKYLPPLSVNTHVQRPYRFANRRKSIFKHDTANAVSANDGYDDEKRRRSFEDHTDYATRLLDSKSGANFFDYDSNERWKCKAIDENMLCVDPNDNDSLIMDNSDVNYFVDEFLSKPKNIVLETRAVCKCKPGYFYYPIYAATAGNNNESEIAESGKCLKISEHMQNCNFNEECEMNDANMACQQIDDRKKCVCKQEFDYNSTLQKCYVRKTTMTSESTPTSSADKRCPEGRVWNGSACRKKSFLASSKMVTVAWCSFSFLAITVVVIAVLLKARESHCRRAQRDIFDERDSGARGSSFIFGIRRLRHMAARHNSPPPAFSEVYPAAEQPPPSYSEALLLSSKPLNSASK
ncbi:hypothetical protein B4U79_15450, partial [Dinothrombium tinctorium]